MQRALDLARTGQGRVEPNPCVGAVIVDEQLQLLGEGCHEQYGGPHAEVMALQDAGPAARGATLFVTLEPCNHHGRTPPCTQAIIAAGIHRAVVAVRDPARHGTESGIEVLRAAGLDVTVGICAPQAESLIAPFTTLMTRGRPYIHAKWAMTLDGKLATYTGHSKWISNAASRERVHALRGHMDGILTGIGTVLADNPLLTARPAGPRVATRIVLDSHARLPLDSQLVQSATAAPVLLVTTAQADPARCQAIAHAGVEVLICERAAEAPAKTFTCDLWGLLQELRQRGFTNLLLEAGSHVLGAFHDMKLIDEVHCFIAPKLSGGATAPSPLGGIGLEQIPEHSTFIETQITLLDGDIYFNGRVRPLDEVL